MSQIVAAVFDDADQADRMLDALKEFERGGLLQLEGVARGDEVLRRLRAEQLGGNDDRLEPERGDRACLAGGPERRPLPGVARMGQAARLAPTEGESHG